jgi:aldehyde dehydrogenase (NAD+)
VIDREPYGVVGVLLPWNVPIASVCMKSMAALAAGNCVVIKSPEIAPFGMMRFAELVEQAGFPPGVISILAADGEGGQALCADPRVGKLTFTGGASTAAKVVTAAAANVTPALLELGGKSATLLFEDADLDVAVPSAVEMSVAGAGQVCILSSRLLVQRSIYEEVVERARARFAAMTVGDPFLPETYMGPVISETAAERIVGVVEAAAGDGSGRLVCGGGRVGGRFAKGSFVQPALFADVRPESSLFQNEVFGPVLAITPFSDEGEAIRLANDTRYGLYSYVHTRDGARAMRVARALTAGSVAVNGMGGMSPRVPFGGFGLSGYGKEGGREGLDEFLRSKSIFIAE